jgi:hypothetical protein
MAGCATMDDFISYEHFGVNFVRYAVTAERIKESITGLTTEEIVSGPNPAGPGGIATAKSVGRVGEVRVVPEPDDISRFKVVLPIELDLDIKLGPVSNRYKGLVEVPVLMTVRTADPLTIVIEVSQVHGKDIRADIRPANVGADLLSRVGNIEGEVKSEVARLVNEKMNSTAAKASRVIDVAELIDRSYDTE